ncbi:Arginine ABC transporter permease protein ArtQ [Pantoea agglomerans]|uniref:Arginine ABC transporter permease protein ArtQ n=1 Tax=Enterobacter agglomerans TaxID=549 RepID=A0A379AI66_ENTAG|nr:Arginine ABC transporter permease protein ArtQ [Pantoea agglomerans]
MNEMMTLASAAGMTVGLAVCALIAGLVLAMIFAGWESLRLKPLAWIGTGLVTLIRGLPEILVVLFIYFGASQLLLTLSDGFTLNFGLFQLPIQVEIENFDVSPFLCGVIALAMLYAAYASQTLRGALKSGADGSVGVGSGAGHEKIGHLSPADYAADVASRPARSGQSVAGAAERYRAGLAD